MFLPSQQGLLRGDDGHDAPASSLTSARTQRDRPSSAPTAFSLGLLGFFFTETEQAGLTQASPELPTPPASAEVAEGVKARDGGDGSRSR